MAINDSNSAEAIRSKVAAGYKGGQYFGNMIKHPEMTVESFVPAEVKTQFQVADSAQGKGRDTWKDR